MTCERYALGVMGPRAFSSQFGRRRHRARRWPGCLARGALHLSLLLLVPSLAVPARAAPSAAPLEAGTTQIALWPEAAPGSRDTTLTESISERSQDREHRDRFVVGVSRPRLVVFPATKPNGTALIIAPGGGYVREVLDKEGFETARWMAARGVSAFVLLYRLPGEGHAARADVPLQDAQRAVRVLRGRARELGVDAQRIGFMGFSAGGHVAASVATRFDAQVYAPLDALDAVSARPDFSILLYPVISLDPSIAHDGSRRALLGDSPSPAAIRSYSADQNVTAKAPPTLLILADDDPSVAPENALRYYRALHQMSVPAELHVFSQGKHGFGIRGAHGLPVGNWPELAWSWLTASGFVPASKR
jgi:acetyl esterase/lipase